ncbi:MAG: alpha/beta hydrolase [Candidatus Velthaea sp.]
MAYVRNGDMSLALETRGCGPVNVLCLHGWISSRRMWFDVADRLDPARYTLHLLDLRGAGLSDRPPTGHDLPGYASDVRAALASIDAPVTLVAHSMGGKIAQFVALEPPANLQRLVLLAPASAKGTRLDEKHRSLALDAFGSRTRIERFQRGAMTRPISAASMERIVNDALGAQREAWFGWYEHGRTADFFDRLGEIALPTVIVGGDCDPLAPPSRVRTTAQAIRGALAVFLHDVGHNLPVEAPGEIAQLIDRLTA